MTRLYGNHVNNPRTGKCRMDCPDDSHNQGPRRRCARCGDLATGFATINGKRYCHAEEWDCYESEQRAHTDEYADNPGANL